MSEQEVSSRGRPYWTCYTVTVANAVVSLGFSASAVAHEDTGIAVNARYAASRSAALALLALSAPLWRRSGVLPTVATAMTIVQAIDAGIGLTIRDRAKTVGPAVTALATAASLGVLTREQGARPRPASTKSTANRAWSRGVRFPPAAAPH